MIEFLEYKAVIVGVVFAGLFLLERVFRKALPPRNPARLWRNGALWLIVVFASPLIVVPIAGLGANQFLWARPAWMSSGLAASLILIVDIIILDIWTYWLHRSYHKIPVLWRFHEVHHRDEFLDTTSAVRFHLGEVVISSSLRLVIIAFIAAPVSSVLFFEILLLASALFHHSNISLPEAIERRLALFVVTPSIHWVHHHAVRADTDSNYASFLSCWDDVFASRSQTKRSKGMKIGVEGLEDESIFRLMFMPFRKS